MKQCINCLNANITTVVQKNHIFYYCKNCKALLPRVSDSGKEIAVLEYKNGIKKHVTVAALIQKNDKILLFNRRNFPFGLCLPCGHLEVDENPQDGADREVLEETGLEVIRKKLIFNKTIPDRCKAGADYHEWYLYDCETKGDFSLNSEMSESLWIPKNKLNDVNLVAPLKRVFSELGYIEKQKSVSPSNPPGPISQSRKTSYRAMDSVLEKIPMSIVNCDINNKLLFSNKSAAKLIDRIRNEKSYDIFLKNLASISSESIKSNSNVSRLFNLGNDTYEISSNPIIENNSIIGSSSSITNVTYEHKQELKDVLAYQTSIELFPASNDTKLISQMLKQLMSTLSLQSCDLVTIDPNGTFKTQCEFYKNRIEISKNENEIKWVVKNKSPLAIPDTGKDNPLSTGRSVISVSLLSVPVILNRKVLGTLNLTKPTGRFFTEDEMDMAMIIANRIALAKENTRLGKSLIDEKRTFETVLKTTTDGLIMVDKNLKLTFANKAATSMLPLKSSEVEDGDFQSYLGKRSKNISEQFRSLIRKSIKEKQSLSAEFSPRKGGAKTLSLKFNPIIEKGGRCCSVLIGINNITKLKEKQKTVEKQVRQITNLFKISAMSQETDDKEFVEKILTKTEDILESEESNIIIFDNETASSLPEFSAPIEVVDLVQKINIVQKPSGEYLNNSIKSNYPDINYNIRNFITTPLRIKNKVRGLLYALNKKGDYHSGDLKLISIIGSRISSRLESILLFQEIARDNEQMQNIIANTGDGIIVRDSVSRIIIFNKAMQKISGFDKAEDYVKVNPETNNNIAKILKESIIHKKSAIYKEVKIKDADNDEKWLGTTYSFIKNRVGNIDYIISVIRDISKEKEIEAQQKEFIYTAAHELRTPIAVIKGYLSMILAGDAGTVNAKQKNYFDRTVSSANKLALLVEDLLEATRLEEGRANYSIQSFNAYDLVNTVTSDFLLKAENKKLRLHFETNGSKDVFLLGDYEKTRQAMSNLVDNAIKYSRKGIIKISVKKKGDFGRIEIADTGVGIPKKDIPRIFDKFVRIPNSESVKAGGTGLGLFIVKNMIEQQGGEIGVQSELKKGSTFYISLPLAKQLKLNWR